MTVQPCAKVFTWDWRGQPDMKAIAQAVSEASGGTVHMREIETGTDEYAWLVADHEPGDDEMRRLYLA